MDLRYIFIYSMFALASMAESGDAEREFLRQKREHLCNGQAFKKYTRASMRCLKAPLYDAVAHKSRQDICEDLGELMCCFFNERLQDNVCVGFTHPADLSAEDRQEIEEDADEVYSLYKMVGKKLITLDAAVKQEIKMCVKKFECEDGVERDTETTWPFVEEVLKGVMETDYVDRH